MVEDQLVAEWKVTRSVSDPDTYRLTATILPNENGDCESDIIKSFNKKYEWLDRYEGIHPHFRDDPHACPYTPEASLYESFDNIDVLLIWRTGRFEVIVEELIWPSVKDMQASEPAYLWLKGNRPVSSSFRNSPFELPLSTTNIPVTAGDSELPQRSIITIDPVGEVHSLITTSNSLSQIPKSAIDIDKLYETERKDAGMLARLYTHPYSGMTYWKMVVGDRPVTFSAFHYPQHNMEAPNNKKKREYIDESEKVEIVRWELKGALSNRVPNDDGIPRDRLYFSFCEMYNIKTEEIYILLQIMTTLCPSNRNDFLVMNKRTFNIECYEGMDQIKNFICLPDNPVDFEMLLFRRNSYFKRSRWIYDPTRGIPRDTKYPGDMSDERRTAVTFYY